MILEQRRAKGRAHPGRQRHILDHHGQAMQQPEIVAGHHRLLRRQRSGACFVGGERHDRIEDGVEALDHREVGVEDFDRADPPRTNVRGELAGRQAGGIVAGHGSSHVDDGDDRAAAMRPLVHRVDGDEHRRVPDRGRRDAADDGLGMAMVMHVGIVEHDLAPAAQPPGMVRLALH